MKSVPVKLRCLSLLYLRRRHPTLVSAGGTVNSTLDTTTNNTLSTIDQTTGKRIDGPRVVRVKSKTSGNIGVNQ